MNWLATMECKKEDTEMVEIFFRLFNKALANFLCEDSYKSTSLTKRCCVWTRQGQTYKVYGMFSAMLTDCVMSMVLYGMCMEAIAIYRCQ